MTVSGMTIVADLRPIRRVFPGGDWLAVEVAEQRLPAWGQALHERFAAVLVLAGEGVYRDHAGAAHALAPGMAFHHLPRVRHRVQRFQPARWRQLVLRASPGAWEALATFAEPVAAPVWRAGPAAAAALLALHGTLADPAVPGWTVLARAAEALAQLAPAAADPWDVAASALAADRQRRIDLRRLAGELGFSYSHFRRGFRRRHGVAPAAWRRGVRLAEAGRLLGAGWSAAATARATGWSGAQALAKARRKLTRR